MGKGKGSGDGAGGARGKTMRVAVPAMPMPLAILCCILNFLVPGLGITIINHIHILLLLCIQHMEYCLVSSK